MSCWSLLEKTYKRWHPQCCLVSDSPEEYVPDEELINIVIDNCLIGIWLATGVKLYLEYFYNLYIKGFPSRLFLHFLFFPHRHPNPQSHLLSQGWYRGFIPEINPYSKWPKINKVFTRFCFHPYKWKYGPHVPICIMPFMPTKLHVYHSWLQGPLFVGASPKKHETFSTSFKDVILSKDQRRKNGCRSFELDSCHLGWI